MSGVGVPPDLLNPRYPKPEIDQNVFGTCSYKLYASFWPSMSLWRTMSQDLNFNVMFSPRGVLNIAHTNAQYDVFARRANAMCLNGIDAELLSREEVLDREPIIDGSATTRFPVWGGILQPLAGNARHDAVVWAYARGADRLGVDIIQNCLVTTRQD